MPRDVRPRLLSWHLASGSTGQGDAVVSQPLRRDDRLRGGIARTIPGDLKYAAKAKLSEGAEYLYIVASTEPGRNRISPLAGAQGKSREDKEDRET